MDLLLRNAKVFTPAGPVECDVAVKDGKVTKVAGDLQEQASKVIDLTGKYVFPGLVDGHTHMEFPFMGTVTADDFFHGTRAAVAGGVTTIVDFITPPKGSSLLEAYKTWRSNADPKVISDYGLHMIVREATPATLEEIPTLIGQGVVSFKLFMAYKGELMLTDGEIYRLTKKISENGGVVGVHAENGEVIDELVGEYLRQGKVEPVYHSYTRPEELEVEATNRVATIGSVLGKGVKMYIVHTSTGESVDVMSSYRRKGYKFFNETTPHYLVLNVDALRRPDGHRFVCSPPYRSDEQRTKLWHRLGSGEIFTVGSDHCVYSDQQKRRFKDTVPPFNEIPNGVPGTETILPILFHFGVRKGLISPETMVAVTSYNSARLYGLFPRKGTFSIGSDADFAVLDPNLTVKITPDVLHSNIDYTIYDGVTVTGWNVMTIRRGEVVFQEGQVIGSKGSGSYVPGSNPTV
ncbi:dihydropyrimidinase [Sulfodiicoccus acidiphilus]|uniref:Dihydropyrimidinase n=1 Tax=Sulfodiicoccus acidiphilus TaxID=1670455 RepID=A0A348B624_9CREN|nr:dihydropyrimidinase [Sulfodiicoccus acidiphilus]BBD73626.1 dihydropyrimidinase [Sulfodiicoccus acidiphilus]GGU04677.1 dihydropyrimidinase [Sulfodiicoccus acidiphilus]